MQEVPAHKKESLYIIKIGGNIIDDEAQLLTFLQDFASLEGKKILVHGGGKLATRVAEAMGITQQLVDGRRITNAETLKVVTMVYAGYINKTITAQLQAAGINAMGLSGADGNLLKAHKRIHTAIDYGFAGDIDEVNTGLIGDLLQRDICLVVAPITHDQKGLLLNSNADSIAQEMARALAPHFDVSLVYCFEKNGVLMNADEPTSIIPMIDPGSYLSLKERNIISAGMIPKLDNAFAALKAGVQQVRVGHARHLKEMINQLSGTAIVYE